MTIFVPTQGSDTSVVDQRDSTDVAIYRLDRDAVGQSSYEMIPDFVRVLIRNIDGESWASWRNEHVARGSDTEAAVELWEQLGRYFDSLLADEQNLAPGLLSDLRAIRETMRHRP